MQRGYRSGLRWHLGLPSAHRIAGQYRRGAQHREPAWQSAVARRGGGRDRSGDPCLSDWRFPRCARPWRHRFQPDEVSGSLVGLNKRVQFIFGLDNIPARHVLADDLPANAWQTLKRPARYEVKTVPRRRPKRVKEQIVKQRGFENLRLEGEEVAEFPYRPVACKNIYRMIVLRKDLAVEKGEQRLFDDYRYLFYLTN